MTFENAKRLYAHYNSIGRDKAAQDLLNKYPELEEKTEPKPEKKETNIKKAA